MPAFAKAAMTRAYIAVRRRREAAAARRLGAEQRDGRLRVVYITGFPRSGTTMLKYYFSAHPGLVQSPFTPVGFFDVWERAKGRSEVFVDKSNHYIYSLETLFAGTGHGARVVVVVRDPRDCLVSLASYEENREVPRDGRFWGYWAGQHRALLEFARGSEFGERLFLLRYEDLVRFPEQAKACYLGWLGFDVEASGLDRRYRNEHPGEGWRDSVHDYKEIGAFALQKWASASGLPDWCSSRLQDWQGDGEVAEMMRAFGYDLKGFRDPQLGPGPFALFRPSDA